jgi:hypothetical protein
MTKWHYLRDNDDVNVVTYNFLGIHNRKNVSELLSAEMTHRGGGSGDGERERRNEPRGITKELRSKRTRYKF